jgi:hypothetical protein
LKDSTIGAAQTEACSVHQIGKGLNVRVFGVDPTCILALQRLINLFRISRNAFKLARLRISHHQESDALGIVDLCGEEGAQVLGYGLANQVAGGFFRES